MAKSKFALPLDDPKKLISALENKQLTAEAYRPDFQPRINLAFMRGHHYIVMDPVKKQLVRAAARTNDPNAPVRITVNKVGGQIDRLISKLTKSAPVPEARPVSDEDDDISAARVATRILASEAHRIHLPVVLQELYTWVVPVGWAYLQTTWDTNGGDYVIEGIKSGNVNVEVVPHVELVSDPAAREFCKSRWAIRTIGMPAEEVYERYGKEVSEGGTHRTLSAELIDLGEFGLRKSDTSNVAVRQFWLRPGAMKDHPDGLVLTWAGQTILEEPKAFPYSHGRLPFTQFNFLPPQGTIHGRSPIDDLIPMQMDYNDARSREATHRRYLAPKLIYPSRSVDPNKLTTRFEAIPYDPTGMKPEYVEPSSTWMQQHEVVMNRADEEMGDRTGLTEAARGQLAGSAAAASVLAQQEAAVEPLGIAARQLASGLEEYGYQHIMLVKQYWKEKRLVATYSEAGNLEVDRFKGSNISEQLDLHVTQESALPKSKAGRMEMATQLWQQGIIQDPRTLIRMLDLPQSDVLADSFNQDVREAEYENGELLRGNIVQVQLWQNQEEHFKTHNRLRKSAEYRNASPKVKAAIDDHCKGHEMVIGVQMAPPAQFGTGAPGEPPAPPTAPEIGPALPPQGDLGLGFPVSPEMVAGGLAPGPELPPQTLAALAGIGTDQGAVPGIAPDLQAALTGN